MENERGWQHLADEVKRRRSVRGWTQMEVATRGGLSLDRVSSIESVRTDRYSGRTITKLERALEWELGSVRAILAGGQPTPTEQAAPPRQTPPAPPAEKPMEEWTLEDARAELAALEAKVEELIARDKDRDAG